MSEAVGISAKNDRPCERIPTDIFLRAVHTGARLKRLLQEANILRGKDNLRYHNRKKVGKKANRYKLTNPAAKGNDAQPKREGTRRFRTAVLWGKGDLERYQPSGLRSVDLS